MDFLELIINRRTIRAFLDKPVSEETVREIIEESLTAPSGGNRQPWAFSVVMGQEKIKQFSDSSKKGILETVAKDPSHYMKVYETALQNEKFNVFYDAPALVFIMSEKNSGSSKEDCSLLAAYFMLAATNKGLGTAWVGLGGYPADDDLRAEIGINNEYDILAPIALGYPKRIPKMPERNEAKITIIK